MPDNILSNEDLKAATGCKSQTALENCLRSQKIRFLYGKNGKIFTTTQAINSAMGLTPDTQEPACIDFKKTQGVQSIPNKVTSVAKRSRVD